MQIQGGVTAIVNDVQRGRKRSIESEEGGEGDERSSRSRRG